jgi:hypothetical protein
VEPWSEVRTTVKEGKWSCERGIYFCVYIVYVLKRAEERKRFAGGGVGGGGGGGGGGVVTRNRTSDKKV